MDGGLGSALNARPDLRDSLAVGSVGGDGDGLDEELVFAADVERRILLHGLEENLDFDMAGGFDAAGVGSHAVSGRGCVRWLESWRVRRWTYCLGAVVLTLKAMGELVGLERRRIWETSWVKGPIRSGT